jgi:isochorismate synthase/2-succinyl-5-enolpyruvyl-6-hydroxy-3-cyclohexene-1-carboxylate synthase/2-succinyl-6-hydroxy-2,4-cyclohexadiene-1-carboxylate synthase/O-succinylbenzoate synthase
MPCELCLGQASVVVLLCRPYELRDTGANQTIDQVKIFGGYTRWASDVCPPSDPQQLPGRVILSTVDTALRHAVGGRTPGPVHLNFQFREPLAPSAANWDASRFLRGLEGWQGSAEPYTTQVLNPGVAAAGSSGSASVLLPLPQQLSGTAAAAAAAASPELGRVLQLLLTAKRGLISVGEQSHPGAAAAAVQLAAALGWPAAADVLSGLRVGSSSSSSSSGVLQHFDHVLLGPGAAAGAAADWWGKLQPDVVVQLGPRVTSKRVNQFMVRTRV